MRRTDHCAIPSRSIRTLDAGYLISKHNGHLYVRTRHFDIIHFQKRTSLNKHAYALSQRTPIRKFTSTLPRLFRVAKIISRRSSNSTVINYPVLSSISVPSQTPVLNRSRRGVTRGFGEAKVPETIRLP